MRIMINGHERAVDDGLTIAGLLDLLGVEPRGVAVERNREIAPKSRHAATVLEDGDRLEIIQFVGGG